MSWLDLDRLPADRLYAPEQDMWVQPLAEGRVRVGSTHLVASHGQFMLFTPRPLDTPVARDRSLGVMETAKTAVAIHAPVSGVIRAINDAAEAKIERVSTDPYGTGWLFELEPSAWEAERADLLDVQAYRTWLAPRMDRFKAPLDDEPTDVFDPTRWT